MGTKNFPDEFPRITPSPATALLSGNLNTKEYGHVVVGDLQSPFSEMFLAVNPFPNPAQAGLYLLKRVGQYLSGNNFLFDANTDRIYLFRWGMKHEDLRATQERWRRLKRRPYWRIPRSSMVLKTGRITASQFPDYFYPDTSNNFRLMARTLAGTNEIVTPEFLAKLFSYELAPPNFLIYVQTKSGVRHVSWSTQIPLKYPETGYTYKAVSRRFSQTFAFAVRRQQVVGGVNQFTWSKKVPFKIWYELINANPKGAPAGASAQMRYNYRIEPLPYDNW